MNKKMTGAELLDSGKRFSVTMWEYSWLVQRSGKQCEYADWDKVLDELVERGYECIRIDAFPHCIAKDPDGKIAEEISFLALPKNFMWGNHENVTVNPREGLVEFMKKAKARGLYIGLSSWYNDDDEHRKLMVRSPQDYSRIWIETLDLLNHEGLLDIVVWVDLCNEFPFPSWCPVPFKEITGADPENFFGSMLALSAKWKEKSIRRMGEYYRAIKAVKDKYPKLKYTFSCQAVGEKNIQRADVGFFDLAEPHIWSVDNLYWNIKSKHIGLNNGEYPDDLIKHVLKVMKLYPKYKKKIYSILDKRTSLWADWAKKKKLPLITTEAWASIQYEDITQCGLAGEWDWFKEVAEMGVKLAVRKGWQGICTSNFCQPHFEGMWYDEKWHRRMTDLIKKGM